METSEQHNTVTPPAAVVHWQHQNFHRPTDSIPLATITGATPQMTSKPVENVNINENKLENYSSNNLSVIQKNTAKQPKELIKTSNLSSTLSDNEKTLISIAAAPVPVITNFSAGIENRHNEFSTNRTSFSNHETPPSVMNTTIPRLSDNNDSEFKGGGVNTGQYNHPYYPPTQNHPSSQSHHYQLDQIDYHQYQRSQHQPNHYMQYPPHQHHHHQQHQHMQQHLIQLQHKENSSSLPSNVYANRIGTDEKYSSNNSSSSNVKSNKKSDILINDHDSTVNNKFGENKLNYYNNCDAIQTNNGSQQMQHNQHNLDQHNQKQLSLHEPLNHHEQPQSKDTHHPNFSISRAPDVDAENINIKSVISRSNVHAINQSGQHSKTVIKIAGLPEELNYKSNNLYVMNPDFTKVPPKSPPTQHLMQLQMKSPNFSKVTSTNSPLHVPDPDFTKTSKEPISTQQNHQVSQSSVVFTESHITLSDFTEKSKKFNYISDLQLKKPMVTPPQLIPVVSSSHSYPNLYIKHLILA